MDESLSYSERLGYRQYKHNGLTIEGLSRAAVQTFWRIPEYKLGFDLGGQPWEFMGTPRWFISHTHLDHLLALPAYIARRRMMKMEPPVLYVPASKVAQIRQLLDACMKLDRGQFPCTLIPVEGGETFELSRELLVTAHRTYHTIPSVGYIVWERRKKLKAEFTHLSGEEIRDLNQAGVEITHELRFPKVAYLGDSTCRALDEHTDMYRAEILIMESTFLAPQHRKEAINKFGHCHLDDLVQRKDRFENQRIILSHFSIRYFDNQIEHLVRKQFPDLMDNRLVLWY